MRDQLSEMTEILKHRRQKLKVGLDAAEAYMQLQPPHQTVGEAVANALNRANAQGAWGKFK